MKPTSIGLADWESLIHAQAEEPPSPLIKFEQTENMLLLHWGMDAEEVQKTLPRDLEVDTYGAAAYVGVCLGTKRNVRVPTPGVRKAGFCYHQLDVRTYVRDRTGTPGLWLYSVDCSNPVIVSLGSCLLGWNGFISEMSADINGAVDFQTRRRGRQDWMRYRYRSSGPERDMHVLGIEFFLLERYNIFFAAQDNVWRTPVRHESHRYHPVDVEVWSGEPAALAGFAGLNRNPDHACVVSPYEASIYQPCEVAV
jgi:uncharacterized protein YqjF (DUF2071 family)